MKKLLPELNPNNAGDFFNYDHLSGKLFWKKRDRCYFSTNHHHAAWNTNNAGKEAGRHYKAWSGNEYLHLTYNHETHSVHRIVWMIVKRETPDNIDHINGDGLNNKIDNLRSVIKGENNKNQKLRKDNKSGVPGVMWKKQAQKWCVQISSNNKRVHIGYFTDIHDAIHARLEANKKYGFHENHGRSALNEYQKETP